MNDTAYKLLAFDWDGTLMNSEAHIVSCMQGTIRDLALEPRSHEQIRNIIGLGMNEAIKTLYPDGDNTMRTSFVESYKYHFREGDKTPYDFFPGALGVISELRDLGYLVAVATGKGRPGLDRVLSETGTAELFHSSRCADETRSKPHPQMLLELIEEFSVTPDQTLMIGDTAYDMEMAQNAGAHRVAACYGVHDRERLQQYRPIASLDAITDLPDILNRILYSADNSREYV